MLFFNLLGESMKLIPRRIFTENLNMKQSS
jgi:hypothetical protein